MYRIERTNGCIEQNAQNDLQNRIYRKGICKKHQEEQLLKRYKSKRTRKGWIFYFYCFRSKRETGQALTIRYIYIHKQYFNFETEFFFIFIFSHTLVQRTINIILDQYLRHKLHFNLYVYVTNRSAALNIFKKVSIEMIIKKNFFKQP